MTVSKKSIRVFVVSVLLALAIFAVGQIWNALDESGSAVHMPDPSSSLAYKDKRASNKVPYLSERDNGTSPAQNHGDHKTTRLLPATNSPIAPSGEDQDIASIPPEFWESMEEAWQDMNDPLPEIRATAVETLIKQQGEGARDILLTALDDSDPHVRSHALNQAMNYRLYIPLDTIQLLAEGDTSPEVRLVALTALTNYPMDSQGLALELRATAELAMNDADESVQRKAQQILEQLDRPESTPLDDWLRQEEWETTQGSSDSIGLRSPN
jgi:hypothetical protein